MNSWPEGYKNKDLDCTNVSLKKKKLENELELEIIAIKVM